MLRVLHVVALTFASGRSELGTSKSLLQKERSDKVNFLGRNKQGNGKIHMWGKPYDLWG